MVYDIPITQFKRSQKDITRWAGARFSGKIFVSVEMLGLSLATPAYGAHPTSARFEDGPDDEPEKN